MTHSRVAREENTCSDPVSTPCSTRSTRTSARPWTTSRSARLPRRRGRRQPRTVQLVGLRRRQVQHHGHRSRGRRGQRRVRGPEVERALRVRQQAEGARAAYVVGVGVAQLVQPARRGSRGPVARSGDHGHRPPGRPRRVGGPPRRSRAPRARWSLLVGLTARPSGGDGRHRPGRRRGLRVPRVHRALDPLRPRPRRAVARPRRHLRVDEPVRPEARAGSAAEDRVRLSLVVDQGLPALCAGGDAAAGTPRGALRAMETPAGPGPCPGRRGGRGPDRALLPCAPPEVALRRAWRRDLAPRVSR